MALSQPARADSDSAGGAVLCLAGVAAGQSGGWGYTGYHASYLSIRVFKGGDFQPDDTFSKRATS